MPNQHTQKKFRETIVEFLERYTIHFYVVATLLYLAMIPLSLWVFPSTTMLLTIIVLFSGFVSSVGALASVLVDLHQNDRIDDVTDDVENLGEDVNDLADDGQLNNS